MPYHRFQRPYEAGTTRKSNNNVEMNDNQWQIQPIESHCQLGLSWNHIPKGEEIGYICHRPSWCHTVQTEGVARKPDGLVQAKRNHRQGEEGKQADETKSTKASRMQIIFKKFWTHWANFSKRERDVWVAFKWPKRHHTDHSGTINQGCPLSPWAERMQIREDGNWQNGPHEW